MAISSCSTCGGGAEYYAEQLRAGQQIQEMQEQASIAAQSYAMPASTQPTYRDPETVGTLIDIMV